MRRGWLPCRQPQCGHALYTLTWSYGGAPDSWVTLTLADAGEGGTSVELEHIARAADLPEGMWERFGPGATGAGWDGALLGLALELGDDGAALTDREAWQAGEEGRRFARRSADAWAAADAASGTDPATATARGNATYAVVKNTLTELAAKEAGVDAFDGQLVGPSAIAFVRLVLLQNCGIGISWSRPARIVPAVLLIA